jgi:hypothetical protein
MNISMLTLARAERMASSIEGKNSSPFSRRTALFCGTISVPSTSSDRRNSELSTP